MCIMYKNQKGLIFTNDKCIGCNKCISVCPVIVANRAVKTKEGIPRIEVDGDKCIACGACFDACEHNAREFVDDTEEFLQRLQEGSEYLFCGRLHLQPIIPMNIKRSLAV